LKKSAVFLKKRLTTNPGCTIIPIEREKEIKKLKKVLTTTSKCVIMITVKERIIPPPFTWAAGG